MADFTPIIKISTNVKEDLSLIASSHKIEVNEVDFDLLSYETYYQKAGDNGWHPVEGANVFKQITQEELYSRDFLLRQEYHIRIRPFIPHQFLDLRFSIAMNKNKGIITALIDPSSVIPLKKGVQGWIKEVIDRRKLRLGYLIATADEELEEAIMRFLATLQKKGALSEPYPIVISRFFPAIESIDDAIVLHYKKGREPNSMIEGVQPDDLLLEYILPKRGHNGRGCDGAPIVVAEPKIKYAGILKIDNATIRSEQDENSIRYYAKISGFVERVQGVFRVSQALSLESVSVKKTGFIEAGIDKEISLAVTQNTFNEDAVGMGMSIDIQKVNIDGIVGENTKIKAEELTIGAQTHRKSHIDVTDVATIQLHRGDLRAKEAIIDVLEGGRIEADVVRINKMLGGEVIATSAYIDTLYSHAKVTALERIEITQIVGEDNVLMIDPYSVQVYHEKIAQTQIQIADKEELYALHLQELIAQQHEFKGKNIRIKEFQKRVMQAQEKGVEPMRADVVRVRQYQGEAQKLQYEAGKLREEQEYLNALRGMLEKLYEADLHGVIMHKGRYNGHNRVAFVDPKTREEHSIFPNGTVAEIRLELQGEEKKLRLTS